MDTSEKHNPKYLWSLLAMNCPRCRSGRLFKTARAYNLKHIFDMHEECGECKQKFNMEPGFWYGTGYVSYGLTVAISIITFIAWWIFIGVSFNDNRVFWWLGLNAALLVVIQPWLMRFSRTIYLYFFVRYDKEYKTSQPITFD